MSHLARIIDLKTVMQEQGCTCPVEQSKVIEAIFVKAGISFIYRSGKQNGNPDARVGESLLDQLNLWNSVSPINGLYIANTVTESIRVNYNQGCTGGNWTPFVPYTPVEFEQTPAFVEACAALETRLLEELCNKDI